ncbi:ATP-binding protein [Tissierella praeacuta]|uniref:ATP-binding protein n=1 Tax=Tissierella praeacuta TaxID=43131 RepID=UPI003340DBDA
MENISEILEQKIKEAKERSTYLISGSKEQEKSTIQTSYDCEICKDTEWIDIKDELGLITSTKPCKCVEIKRYKRILEKSGISKDFLKIGFKEFETEGKHETVIKAKEAAISYFKNFQDIKNTRKNSITFLSKNYKLKDLGLIKTGVGAGKTHLSIALANNIMNKHRIGVLYMPYRDVITKLKQNMIDEEYYQREVDKFKNASVLLIDDLFKGKINGSDINIMFEIINHRYLNNKPIICSSEFGKDDLISFDQATGSRILEMSKDYLVEIGLSREELIQGKTINYRLS